MPSKDPRIDAYIEKARPFAQPILTRIRKAVHSACPDVAETVKWSIPAFEYKGPLVGMAAFNEHCTLGFWKASLMKSDATRSRRLETAVAWIAEGKGRNWKYER